MFRKVITCATVGIMLLLASSWAEKSTVKSEEEMENQYQGVIPAGVALTTDSGTDVQQRLSI